MSFASTAQEEGPEPRRTPSHAEREGWRRTNPRAASRPPHLITFNVISIFSSSPLTGSVAAVN